MKNSSAIKLDPDLQIVQSDTNAKPIEKAANDNDNFGGSGCNNANLSNEVNASPFAKTAASYSFARFQAS